MRKPKIIRPFTRFFTAKNLKALSAKLTDPIKENKLGSLQLALTLWLVYRVEGIHVILQQFGQALNDVFGTIVMNLLMFNFQMNDFINYIRNTLSI